MNGLRVEDLTVWYGSHQILDSVSLFAEPGSALGLVGASGSGKSTTLKAIGGVLSGPLETCHGKIWMHGKEVTGLPAEKRDAPLVFQQLHLFEMSVEQNIVFGLQYRGVSKPDAHRRAGAIMEQLGLWELRQRGVTTLSGGERQRVAVARAVVLRPRILLLDEAWNSLDRPLRVRVIECIREIQHKVGTTVVFASHDQQQTLEFADQIVVLGSGRVSQAGVPDEVYWWPLDPGVGESLGPFNCITGTLETMTGGERNVRLELAGLPRMTVRPRFNRTVDGPVMLGFRPSAVVLSSLHAESSGPLAVVLGRRCDGEQLIYDIRLNGAETTWQACVPRLPNRPQQQFSIGDRVSVDVDPELVAIYPSTGKSS